VGLEEKGLRGGRSPRGGGQREGGVRVLAMVEVVGPSRGRSAHGQSSPWKEFMAGVRDGMWEVGGGHRRRG
jgi:hypothetical protein